MGKEERLEAFEKMLLNVKDRYLETINKMEKFKADGKMYCSHHCYIRD